jgi:hypothetical protein
LELPATTPCTVVDVVRLFGASERDHPNVVFYGIRFESLAELESLVLNGFGNSQLALELNGLWQVLSKIDEG